MHDSVYQNETKMSSSYFRRLSPSKPFTLINTSCLKTNPTHNQSSRAQIQSIYQIQSYTEQKKSLKERINQRISKEMSETNRKNKHQNSKNGQIQSKLKQLVTQKNQKRLSCIRKMLFEEQPALFQRNENKENICQNKSYTKNQRQQRRKEFDERQQRLIQLRLQKSALKREQKSKSELKECTFKPKLTKYNPHL